MISIAVVNHSTVVSDAELAAALPDFQAQLDEDFGPAYGIHAQLRIMARDGKLEPNEWQMVVVDTSDQAGALGYHQRSATGTPLGYCFAKSTMNDGARWSTCFSHELLEMLGDPDINRVVLDEVSGRAYAEEVCDGPESDAYAYQKKGGTWVSDFVFRGYWMPNVAPTGPLSFSGNVTRPLEILPGGYLSYTTDLHSWNQDFGSSGAVSSGHGSRHARRALPRSEHRLSTRH